MMLRVAAWILISLDEYYRGGWVHDKTRRRRGGPLLRPRGLGLHLQRLIERLSRVGAGEEAGVQSLSGCPGRQKPEGGTSQLEGWPRGLTWLLVF